MIVPNKFFVIGNWKTKPATLAEAAAIARKLDSGSDKITEVVLAPPALFLETIKSNTSISCSYGIQDTYWKESGSDNAYMSPTQAKSTGCDYAIIGHSSLRALGETDESVNKKVKACLEHDVIPVVCVGESERDEQGGYISFIQDQIRASFADLKKQDFEHVIIAYEPLWAIGSEATREATPAEAEEVRILIEKTIQEMTGNIPVGKITIIYGGSVDSPEELVAFASVGMRGVLVGRASLDPEKFNALAAAPSQNNL